MSVLEAVRSAIYHAERELATNNIPGFKIRIELEPHEWQCIKYELDNYCLVPDPARPAMHMGMVYGHVVALKEKA